MKILVIKNTKQLKPNNPKLIDEWDMIIIANHLKVPMNVREYLLTRIKRGTIHPKLTWADNIEILE